MNCFTCLANRGRSSDKIAEIIQEYADCPDDYDLKKVVAEVRELAIEDFKRHELGEAIEGYLDSR